MNNLLNTIKSFAASYPDIYKGIEIVLVLFGALLIYFVAKRYLLSFIKYFIQKSKTDWDDIFVKKKVFNRLVNIAPALIIYSFAGVVPQATIIIQRICIAYIIFIMLLVINSTLNAINDIYSRFEISREKPIKGFLQILTIFLYFIGIIIIVATLLGKSPMLLLSGIGAMTAVLMLVFKDTILSFVAGVQVTYNNSIRKGDWIVMPKYGADGTVIDIALHNLTIQNWDKTITTIPTHKLIDESFTNWRGMEESGGRRICRNLNIDMTTIKILDNDTIERYTKVELLKEYIESIRKEIEDDNSSKNWDKTEVINGRRLTNIGTFRIYILNFLKNHPSIRKDMTVLVRQLEPTSDGLPIQLYVFTNTTAWVEYEKIQADIFDHLLSIINEFDLKLFQNPSGNDFRRLGEK